MVSQARSSHIRRFGTFEVDLRAGELRKQGKRIRLQEQPFHVLTVLLQRPGDVVSREELRSQIWPEDTFVDFDNSLNTAVNKLREALADSAENPRFIETLPRRGYRFLVPVSGDHRKESAGAAAATGTQRWRAVLATSVVLAAVMAVALFWRSWRRPVLTEKDTIVLGDFANFTGDPVFDGTLREGFSVQLEQSPFLSLVPEEGIQQTLRMMGQAKDVRRTPPIAREVCQRTNSTAVLDSSIALIGTRYDLILKAVNCANGDLLASTESRATSKSHVLDALSKAASEMRTKLGESLSTVQKYNTPLEQATTPSLEALQAYSLGFKAEDGSDIAAAMAFFKRATQIDPNFAMSYLRTAGDYEILGEAALAVENSQKAFALRNRVSALEKLIIEEEHAGSISGDLTEVRQICGLGARTYPRNFIFHEDLGETWNFLGQYESGLEEKREALRRQRTARQQAALLREHASGRDFDYAMALALTYAGDARQASALADGLGRRFPEDTLIQLNYLPTLRARFALVRANPQEALHFLEPAAPYEFGLPATGLYNWPNLYPVYVRGEAYLAAHRGGDAANEFQKILDHRGLVVNEPIGALAHLQLGRAYAMQGDAPKAGAAYQEFLTLWKDADSDIPILQQAKAECAKLR